MSRRPRVLYEPKGPAAEYAQGSERGRKYCCWCSAPAIWDPNEQCWRCSRRPICGWRGYPSKEKK